MKIWDKLSPRSRRTPVQDYSTVFHHQLEADHLTRGIPRDIEGYRAKFKRNLIGQWKTDPGFGPFTVTVWNFYANGTATQTNYSQIVGDNETRFLWREKGDLVIELCQGEDGDDATAWFPVHYNFKTSEGQIVLCQVPLNETFKFYLTTDYPVFEGDHL